MFISHSFQVLFYFAEDPWSPGWGRDLPAISGRAIQGLYGTSLGPHRRRKPQSLATWSNHLLKYDANDATDYVYLQHLPSSVRPVCGKPNNQINEILQLRMVRFLVLHGFTSLRHSYPRHFLVFPRLRCTACRPAPPAKPLESLEARGPAFLQPTNMTSSTRL